MPLQSNVLLTQSLAKLYMKCYKQHNHVHMIFICISNIGFKTVFSSRMTDVHCQIQEATVLKFQTVKS